MAHFFNTAGPCVPDRHYMLPAEARVSEIPALVDEQAYFVIHAPRQVGKTTSLRSLAGTLTAQGRYLAVHASCERGHDLVGDPDWAVSSVVEALARETRNAPDPLRPPAPGEVSATGAHSRLINYLTAWCERCPKPVVLFLDEIDALIDHALITVLRQLRDGYMSRPADFPHSVALIGMRDVRDYKIRVRANKESLGTASPFNVKVESLRLRNFTADEVRELYEQHTDETGQVFTAEAKARAFELTQGQPWLVNAVANQLVRRLVPDRQTAIAAEDVDRAAELLIQRRDTHLDSLIDRLCEPRVRQIIQPILAGEVLRGDRLVDAFSYVEDLGLVRRSDDGPPVIANPIYHEIIPRALADPAELAITHQSDWYRTPDGRLDMPALLEGFVRFWSENGEDLLGDQPYAEIAPHLILMGFLHRIVNAGGTILREYALGRKRLDLIVSWPYPGGVQREALELKVWRDRKGDPRKQGLGQLAGYLKRLDLGHGTLIIFDCRSNAPPFEERYEKEEAEEEGCKITMLRL